MVPKCHLVGLSALADVLFLPRCAALTVGNSVFDGCSLLKSFVLPSVTVRISDSWFKGRSRLAPFELEQCSILSEIPPSAFCGCVLLVKFSLVEYIAVVAYKAFNLKVSNIA
jgi:hypothetical protein